MAAEKTFTPAPETMKIDEKVVKKLVGEAIAGIDGVLDKKDTLSDLFKSDDDVTRGLTLDINNERKEVSVAARVVVESVKNIPDIVNAATKAVTKVIQQTTGLAVKDICIEVADTLTKEEYEARNHPGTLDGTPPNS